MAVITKAVTIIGQVNTVLGCSSGDWGTLCTFASINPFAKCKPIRFYNQDGSWVTRELTDAERIGPTQETSQGYYYGLKLASPAQDFTVLHDMDFDYHKPRGLAHNEAFRILDFVGYDHEARPNLWASISPSGTKNEGIVCSIQYQPTVTTGVPYGDLVEGNIQDYYPCILISNPTRTWYAISCLYNTDKNAYTKLYYQNAWQMNFKANLATLSQITASGGTFLATLFITKHQVTTDVPIDGSWKTITNESVFTAKGYVAPILAKPYAGYTITIGNTSGSPTAVYSGTYSATALGLAPGYTFSSTPAQDVLMMMRWNGDPATDVSWTHRASGTTLAARFRWADLGIVYAAGASFSGTVQFFTRYSTSEPWKGGATRTVSGTMS